MPVIQPDQGDHVQVQLTGDGDAVDTIVQAYRMAANLTLGERQPSGQDDGVVTQHATAWPYR